MKGVKFVTVPNIKYEFPPSMRVVKIWPALWFVKGKVLILHVN